MSSSTYATAVLADSPLVYYRLGESSGSTATDSSGNGRNATYTGATYGLAGALANDSDTAVSVFGGQVQYSAGTGLPLGSSARSVEAWVKPGGGTLISYGSGTVNGRFNIVLGYTNLVTLITNGADQSFTLLRPWNDGNWHQLVLTYAGAATNAVKVYLDGVQAASGTLSSALNTVNSANGLVVASENGCQCGVMWGIPFDEVSIYSTELSESRVSAHFSASGNTRPTAPGSVTATAGTNQATVSWTAATATGSAISHYTVTAFVGSTPRNSVVVPSSAMQAIVSGLAGGTSYTFKVVASNGFGDGPPGTSGAVTPAGSSSTYASTVLADGPSFYYRFGDSAGWAADSGGGHQTTIDGGTFGLAGAITNDPDKAISVFGGQVRYGAGTGLPVGDAPRSVEAWVKGGGTLLSYGSGTVNGRFNLVLKNSNKVTLVSNGADREFTLPRPFDDGAWHQLVVTYRGGGTNLAQVYFDGIFATSGALSSALNTVNSPNGLVVASENACQCAVMWGIPFDEVSIFPTELSGSQVAAHYAASSSSFPSAPQSVRALAAPGGAIVTWETPTSDGGSPINGYFVTAYAGSTPTVTRSVTSSVTSAQIRGLTPSTSYTYKVTAGNGVRVGPQSAASNAVVASTIPPSMSGANGGGFSIYVGYVDFAHGGSFAPSPWVGDPNVSCLEACVLAGDSGAIRFDNFGAAEFVLDSVTVDIGTHHYDLWSSNTLAIPAQGSLILTGGAFDTSEANPENCGQSSSIPVVHVTIGGVLHNYPDTGRVLNTGGVDVGSCLGLNEGTEWLPIGGPPSPFESLGQSNLSENCVRCFTGDPIDDQSGSLAEEFTDLLIPGRGIPLAFTRAYNSLASGYDSYLGYGWQSSYDMSLRQDPSLGRGTITVRQENGGEVTFTPDKNGTYRAPTRVLATLVKNGDGTFTFTRRRRTKFIFLANGQLSRETDLNGYTTTLSYNAGHQVTTVTDPSGRTLTLGHTGSHLTSVSDQAGRSVSFGFNDGAGNLTDVIDIGGGLTHFDFLSPRDSHLLSKITYPMGGVTTNTYDSMWRVDSQTQKIDAMRTRVTGLSYATNKTTVTDGEGNVTVYTFEAGNPVSVTRGFGSPEAATWDYTYDPNTQGVASVRDPNLITTTYDYDSAGNLLNKTVDPSGLNRQTLFTYDSLNDVKTITDPKQVTTTMTYDAAGNLKSVSTPLVENPGQTQETDYFYDDASHPGDVTRMRDPNQVGQTNPKDWLYSYDTYGNRTSVTDPLSNKTTYCFDAVGHLAATLSPKGAADGCNIANPTPYQTTYTTNAFGDVTQVRDPLGHLTKRDYDLDRRLTKLTDGNAHYTQFSYDFVDEMTTVARADLVTTLGYSYDRVGNLLTQTDGAQQDTTYTYDHLNRVASMTPPRATPSSPLRTTLYTYDSAGNLKTIKDPSNPPRTTTFGYTPANERSSITYSDGITPNVTIIHYDPDGQRIDMTDGTGTSTYTWDSLHRMIQSKNGAGQIVGYDYDLKGQLTSITYPGAPGQTVTREFDEAGRLREVSDWLNHTTTFDYDPNSNLWHQTYPNTTVATHAVDEADRLMSITNTKPGLPPTGSTFASFTYTRDNANLLKTLTPTGVTQSNETYGYSNLDQVTSVNSTAYSYDQADNLTQMSPATLVYDQANELIQSSKPITFVSKGTEADAGSMNTLTTSTFSPAAAAGDQILVAVDEANTQTADTPAGYTSLGTFTVPTAKGLERTQLFRKTATGGESSVTVTWPATTPPHARAVSAVVYRNVDPTTPLDGGPVAGSAGPSATSVNGPSLTTTRDGDLLVMIQSALDNATAGASWTPPTGMTNRAAAKKALVSLNIADKLLGAAGATGVQTATLSENASLQGITLALRQATIPLLYFHQDQLGNTRLLTDTSGNVAATYTHDAYGNTTAKTGSATTPLQYAGQYTDAETGFQYLQARYYDPATGQFLTRDPLEMLTREPYGYVGDNPLNTTDPNGMNWLSDKLSGAARAVGSALNAALPVLHQVSNAVAIVAGACSLIPSPVAPLCGGIAAGASAATAVIGTIMYAQGRISRGEALLDAFGALLTGIGGAFGLGAEAARGAAISTKAFSYLRGLDALTASSWCARLSARISQGWAALRSATWAGLSMGLETTSRMFGVGSLTLGVLSEVQP